MTSSVQNTKLYSRNTLTFGGAFFGPLAAIYFFYKNFRNLGKTKEAAWSIPVGIIAYAILFLSPIPQYAALPVLYGGLFGFYEWQMRGSVDAHAKAGGEFYSTKRTILLGLAWLIIFIILFFGPLWLWVKKDYPNLTVGEFVGIIAASDNPATETYSQKSALIEAHDKEALEIFALPATATSDTYIVAADKGLALYRQNLQLIDEMEKIKNLPPVFVEERAKIKRYTELRIQMFELLKQAEIEQTNEYHGQIDAIDRQIADLVDS